MNIGLFGGRFDPPHNGHVQIAREILKRQLADEVWFIPANTHPWRSMVASASDRLAMTKLLEEERIKISDIEIKRGGETYTIDTIKELLMRKTNIKYFWILGSDQLQDFDRWKEYKKLQQLIRFLVFPRKGYMHKELPENFILINNYVATDISSSKIRNRIKKGLPISNFAPKEVEAYIREKGLYK